MLSLLDEVETDQAREPDEIIHINHDNESKFDKSDEHKTFELKGKFSNATLKNSIKINMKPQVYHETHVPCQKDTGMKKFNMLFVDHQNKIKLQ
ncbi:hypothetical protein TNCV_4243721 [Trichonephila clavipes]|nr:hypothetical protein TNCV_4243721 [Trichonephila clavipes]